MEWAVLVVALVLLLGLALARAASDRRRPPTGRPADRPRRTRGGRGADRTELDPSDEADLARGFEAAEQEGAHTLETLLDLRLQVIQSRRVPLRGIRAAPGPHTGRLIFANGTVLLARARRPGELYKLALNLPGTTSMCLDSWTHEEDGIVLHFHWPDDTAELVAIGLDQAD